MLKLLWPISALAACQDGSLLSGISANPLGEGCIRMQFEALNNAQVVQQPFDISLPYNGFDIYNPPTFLSLARQIVTPAFATFTNPSSRCAAAPYDNGASWAGQCRADVSALRDALSIYGNIYPFGGSYGAGIPGTVGDPWYLIQENISHEGYHLSGEFLDLFLVQETDPTTGAYINQADRDRLYQMMKDWWALKNSVLGSNGGHSVYTNGPNWYQFASLNGPVAPDGGNFGENSVVYTQRNMTRQFWGYNDFARAEYGSYENLGLLMRTQYHTAMEGRCGTPGCMYDAVISYTDLTAFAPGYIEGEFTNYSNHEEFHDLRKQIRSMWKTLGDFPQIMPLAWYHKSLPGVGYALFDKAAMTTATVYIPAYGNRGAENRNVLQLLFQNNAETRGGLKAAGWPDAVIDLALAMALGGFYKQEQDAWGSNVGCNGVQWDFIQRCGFVNNIFWDWKYSKDAGQEDLAAKAQVNQYWGELKGWMARNDLKRLLQVPIDMLPWPTCDGPEGSTRNPTPAPQPTTISTTLSPTTKMPTRLPTKDTRPRDTVLPIVVIAPQWANGEPDTTFTTAQMNLFFNLGGTVNSVSGSKPFNGGLKINITENSSQQRTKTNKRFYTFSTIDTDDATATKDYGLFDWPPESDYILEGPYYDPSLIRTVLALNVSNSIGQWAPKAKLCELYVVQSIQGIVDFDTDYRGVYIFRETVKRDSGRLALDKASGACDVPKVKNTMPVGCDPADSGYLMGLLHFGLGDKFFQMGYGGGVNMMYPKGNVKDNVKDWFQDTYLTGFETMLFDHNYIDQDLYSIIDMDATIDYFLLTELMASADAYLYNTYYHYTNKRLRVGPSDSFEYSLGDVGPFPDKEPAWDGGSEDTAGWRYELRMRNRKGSDTSQWYGRLLGDPVFKKKTEQRWAELRQKEFSTLTLQASVNAFSAQLDDGPQSRNEEHWGANTGHTFEEALTSLKSWIAARASWIDNAVTKHMHHSGASPKSFCNAIDADPTPVVGGRRLLQHLNCPLDCWGPYPANFPNCQGSMEWMVAHWKTDDKFAEGGVDGTTCSMQKFLFDENPSQPACPNPCFPDPARDPQGCDIACTGPWLYYPGCMDHVGYVVDHWTLDPKYKAGGVDGSRCSALRFVRNENPTLCPAQCNPSCATNDCEPPTDGSYPECPRNMMWVANNWETDSKFSAGGVDGSSCSVMKFIHAENNTICPDICDTPPPTLTPGTPTKSPIVQSPTPYPSSDSPPPTPPPSLPPSSSPPTTYVKPDFDCSGTCEGPFPGFRYCQLNMDLVAKDFEDNPHLYPDLADNKPCSLQRHLSTSIAGRAPDCPPVNANAGLVCEEDLCVQNPTPPTTEPPTWRPPTNAASIIKDDGNEGSVVPYIVLGIFVPVLFFGMGAAGLWSYKNRLKRQEHRHILMHERATANINGPSPYEYLR